MSRSGLALTIGFATEAVRESAPQIQCVAPLAATPFVADALHGAGARSLVTGTSPDALAATQGADAVVLDLATLSTAWHEGVLTATARLAEAGTPWVLDLTALGSLPPDRSRMDALLALRPTIVRVDSPEVGGFSTAGLDAAVVWGEGADRVTYGQREVEVPRGSAMLAQIPGVRSAVSALIGACAVMSTPLEASLAGAAWLALASERAEEHARGPASFRTALIDSLWTVRGDEIAEYLKV